MACNVTKKQTLAQVLSCKFCEISKNTFLQNTSGRLLLLFDDMHSYATLTNFITIISKLPNVCCMKDTTFNNKKNVSHFEKHL